MKPIILAVFAVDILAAPSRTNSDPVCIVGAGAAGLSAAKALEDKGIKTVIFEKRPEVGGKCQSYYERFGDSRQNQPLNYMATMTTHECLTKLFLFSL
jgi:heterodisulfide reductase subunit A-like polyferredoxin